MTGEVEFEEDYSDESPRLHQILIKPAAPKLVGWLVRKGLAKDERTGARILLTVAMVFFVIAIIIFYLTFFKHPVPPPTKTEVQLLKTLNLPLPK